MATPSSTEFKTSPEGNESATDADDVPDPVVTLHLAMDEPDPPLTGWLDRYMQTILSNAGVDGELSIGIVDDGEMTRLHEQYKGIDGTTDVLTFELGDQAHAESGCVDGEIIVCFDEAKRQAESRGHDVRVELLLYAVHGLLHLIGYDDATEEEARRMHRREDELLNEAGFGSVFYGLND